VIVVVDDEVFDEGVVGGGKSTLDPGVERVERQSDYSLSARVVGVALGVVERNVAVVAPLSMMMKSMASQRVHRGAGVLHAIVVDGVVDMRSTA
jgi:hypothetical protein